jgi:hypothetical protein
MFEDNVSAKEKNQKIIIKKQIVTRTEKIEVFTIEIPEKQITRSLRYYHAPLNFSPSVHDESFDALLIDDSECRKELATLLNLPAIPEKSKSAFDELDGLFDDLVESGEEVDVVKWVKDLRRRN